MAKPDDIAIPDDVIESMCLTWRHDFGLVLDEETLGQWGLSSGMTETAREGLRSQMRQLWQHHIAPAIMAERERCANLLDVTGWAYAAASKSAYENNDPTSGDIFKDRADMAGAHAINIRKGEV